MVVCSNSIVTPWTVAHQVPPSVHGISQARILEWVAISFSRGSSWPKDQTQVSYSGRQILYRWVTWEVDFWILWGKFNNFQLSDTDKYYEARDSGGLRNYFLSFCGVTSETIYSFCFCCTWAKILPPFSRKCRYPHQQGGKVPFFGDGGDFPSCTCYRIQWVEARDAAKRPVMHTTALSNRKITWFWMSVVPEKPWLMSTLLSSLECCYFLFLNVHFLIL